MSDEIIYIHLCGYVIRVSVRFFQIYFMDIYIEIGDKDKVNIYLKVHDKILVLDFSQYQHRS